MSTPSDESRGNAAEAVLRVCSFESRRAVEMRKLIERRGMRATVAPSMREVPLEDNGDVLDFDRALRAGDIQIVVFMTGVGAQAVLEVVETQTSREEFLSALRDATVVVRGPKPAAVMREWNVPTAVRAPEPNTWRELLSAMDAHGSLDGRVVAVQEYGESSDEFYAALRDRGADVRPVPVYRWAFPEDVGPLLAAIRETIAGEHDVLMFTSANQLNNVLQAAADEGLHDDWIAAAKKCVIASIGPTASARIAESGLTVDLEASPPKMGRLVRQIAETAPEILSRRQG